MNDDTLEEPTVANTGSYLINKWGNRIAVGMATNMPPHNLTEVINGTLAYMDNIMILRLMN
jgi:DNA gyrase subunit A